ncbi:MAG: Long-chain-fatty-acid--CoA ligase FadD13 [Syntrophorhabdus sp. PtaU1.Bin153]|nr:MAG: Long-chain-fatty-acid--CoA ligase FadD13 [Syntrophorhabdus sp. PtaU1.Bin153]
MNQNRGSDITTADGLRRHAIKRPNKVAVIFEDITLTFRQLEERASRLANGLLDMGLQKGDRIAIYSANRMEFADFYCGLPKAGLVGVPLSFHMKEEELSYCVNTSDCKMILVEPELVERVENSMSRFKSINRGQIVVFDGNVPPGMIDYEDLLKRSSPVDPRVYIRGEDPFYIGYTSGTTGRPKGAVISHRARVNAFITDAIEMDRFHGDVTLIFAPLCHAAPLINLAGSVFFGAQSVIMRRFNAEEVLRLVEKHHVTNFFGVPTMFNFILMLPPEKLHAYDLSSLKWVVSAGAPLHIGTKKRLMDFLGKDIALHEYYGSSETAKISFLHSDDTIRKNGSVGTGCLGTDIKILDVSTHQPLPVGEVGEIYMRTPSLITEYDQDPVKTKDAFVDDYMTIGDVGYLDEEGYLHLVDRSADMVISGGVNLYPKEIENVLTQHPSIVEAVVIGVPDEIWGESLLAFVVPKEGERLTEEQVIEYVKSQLSGYKVPKKVEIVSSDAIPRQPSGKVLKRELRKPYWAGKSRMI